MNNLDAEFDFWIEEGLNVLIRGKHGIGKTTLVRKAFKRHNLNSLYFSAATMDPWVDLIGVPKEQRDKNNEPYLDLVRPKCLRDDNIQAIFLDEYNRAHKKVRNAVMELIQFKSINGKKFNNLRVVWAAVNPNDEKDSLKYDVDDLDPAQEDRFQIHLDMEYIPNRNYFVEKFNTEYADAALEWWKTLKEEVQDLVSPRRLDYALEIFQKGGDIRNYVIPEIANVGKLIEQLNAGGPIKNLRQIIEKYKLSKGQAKASIVKDIEDYVNDENNFLSIKSFLSRNEEARSICFPTLDYEKRSVLITKDQNIQNWVFDNAEDHKDILRSMASTRSSSPTFMKTRIRSRIDFEPEDEFTGKELSDEDLKTAGLSWNVPTSYLKDKEKNEKLKKDLSILSVFETISTRKVDDTTNVQLARAGKTMFNATNRTEREVSLEILKKVATIKLSEKQSVYAMKILEYHIHKSQISTLLRYKELGRIFNTLLAAVLNNNSEKNVATVLEKDYPNALYKYVFALLNDSKIPKKGFILTYSK